MPFTKTRLGNSNHQRQTVVLKFKFAVRVKSKPVASHGTPWLHNKILHRCDKQRLVRSAEANASRNAYWFCAFANRFGRQPLRRPCQCTH